jgi:hypothetical protein
VTKVTKVEYRLFFAWDEEQEQAYLEQRAREGWLLTSYMPLRYTFRQAEPGEYIYQLDYSSESASAYEERRQVITSFGWEHVLDYLGWRYYRARRGDVEAESLYTDAESLGYKYNHLLRMFIILAAVNFGAAMNVLFGALCGFPAYLSVAVALLVSYAAYRTWQRLQLYRRQLR